VTTTTEPPVTVLCGKGSCWACCHLCDWRSDLRPSPSHASVAWAAHWLDSHMPPIEWAPEELGKT